MYLLANKSHMTSSCIIPYSTNWIYSYSISLLWYSCEDLSLDPCFSTFQKIQFCWWCFIASKFLLKRNTFFEYPGFNKGTLSRILSSTILLQCLTPWLVSVGIRFILFASRILDVYYFIFWLISCPVFETLHTSSRRWSLFIISSS